MSRAAAPAVCLAIATALALPAPAAAQRDCFWTVADDPDAVNVAYPDEGANYWGGSFTLPAGAELRFRGRFPHGRYISFNLYDPAARPTDGLADIDIGPDAGSLNPFAPGARRDGGRRSYTVRVVSGVPPAKREPNTLYLNAAGAPALQGAVLYRLYVPDGGRDQQGGVELPRVSVRLPGGAEAQSAEACALLNVTAPPTAGQAYANSDGIPGPPPRAARDPIRWEAFFNVFYTLGRSSEGTPASGVQEVTPRDKSGGFFSNIDNAYASAAAHRDLGRVLVLNGRSPTFPQTRDGRPVMGSGQLRYWSMCENERLSQRFVDCLYDEDVLTGRAGRFVMVMSTPGDRPANARASCGVNWLAWGAQPEGLLILRHMLPSVQFAQAIQRVSKPGEERDVVGDYLPTGRHTTRASFEGRGCPVLADAALPGSGGRCLPRRLAVSGIRIGPARLGRSFRAFFRRYRALSRGRGVTRFCVRGGRRFLVGARKGRIDLIATTARGHRTRRLGPGAPLRRQRLPGARRIGRGLLVGHRFGGGRVVYGLRRSRVRFLAVVRRRQAARPRRLERRLRRAGLPGRRTRGRAR